MTTRSVDALLLGDEWSGFQGSLRDVPLGGGSCPATIPHLRFHYRKDDAALDAGDATALDALRLTLQAYLDDEEPCVGLRSVDYFQCTLRSTGVVDAVTAYLVGPSVGGVVRRTSARWRKERAAFTTGERAALDAAVSMLAAHLEADEPLS